jgi:NADP-dependent 3-hydroxy acid dehydrogenase YdfG
LPGVTPITLDVTDAKSVAAAAEAAGDVTLLINNAGSSTGASLLDGPKSDPAAVAMLALDELAAGNTEILADDTSRQIQARLSGGVTALYPQFAS